MPGIDVNYFIRQANKLQKELEQKRSDLANQTVEGSAGDLVKVVVTGSQELRSIKIDPKALEGGDVAMLEDLVMAAMNQGLENSRQLMKTELEKISGGVRIPGLT